MSTYSYQVQHTPQTVQIHTNTLVYTKKEILFSHLTGVAISYYAHDGSQFEAIRSIKEYITKKIDTPCIDVSSPIDQLVHKLPKSYTAIPVYLDMVDNNNNRTMIPINLQSSQSLTMLQEVIKKTQGVYKGFGNYTETDRALGIHDPGKTAKIMLFALALPIVFVLFRMIF